MYGFDHCINKYSQIQIFQGAFVHFVFIMCRDVWNVGVLLVLDKVIYIFTRNYFFS